MKTPVKTIMALVLAAAGFSLHAQNRMMMLPPVINLDATGAVAPGHIHFTVEPLAWTAQVSSSWLEMEPTEGTGQTNLFFTAEPNPGPRRLATVTFTCSNPLVPQLIVEVRQYQSLPSGTASLTCDLVEFVRPPQNPFMPLTGMANLTYKPMERGMVFSMLGRPAAGTPATWLVRNAWMPPAMLSPGIQSVSHFFSLKDMGLEPGTPVEPMQLAWTLSYDADTLMPWVPESAWVADTLAPVRYSAIGRPAGNIFMVDTVPNYWPVMRLPWQLTDVVYIGCEMPNGDLNGGTSAGYDINGCGPASAANSLGWLEKKHGKVNIPGSWRDAYEQLGTLMDRDSGQTVQDEDFIRAKLDFIEMYDLPIKVKYQASTVNGDVESSSGNSTAEDQDGDTPNAPAKDWMKKELQDGEDVEVGIGYAGGGGHWVTATGTFTLNGETYLFFKHDTDQERADSTKQQGSPVDEVDGFMSLPTMWGGKIEVLVSESYDPDHQSTPDKERFDRYCQSFKRTLPPDASITITYPDNPNRCFNTSVRVLNRAGSDSYENDATWNFNSGKERTWHNGTGQPVTVEFHNDDHYDGGDLKSYRWYEVLIAKTYHHAGGATDPSNAEAYAGFSIGTDDGTADEFGLVGGEEAVYHHFTGSKLTSFPKGLSSEGLKKVDIQYAIPGWNRYWTGLGLELGIAQVIRPAKLAVFCPTTGFNDTLDISRTGRISIDLGGALVQSFFDISFKLVGSGSFLFDFVGIPSLVQMAAVIGTEPGWLALSAEPGDTSFRIFNLGGNDLVWNLEHKAVWFSATPESGVNSGEINIQYEANAGSARQDTLLIYAAGARNSPYPFVIKQDSASSSTGPVLREPLRADIWPNPGYGEFMLRITGLESGWVRISVTDVIGRNVYRQSKMADNPAMFVPLSLVNLTGGTYFIQVETGRGNHCIKVMVQKTP